MDEVTTRALIRDHFEAAGKDEVRASEIYAEDAVLEFPQGGERIRGKANILAFRSAFPSQVEVKLRRTLGCGDVWINEGTISYDGAPSADVSIMEFRDGKVARETVYVGQSWDPPAWRARWVELIDPETTRER